MCVITRTGTIEEVIAINAHIPEFQHQITKGQMTARLVNKHSLTLVATIDDKVVGYKIGYATSPSQFYSWLGAVIPTYRNQGIARTLRQQQEAWAIAQGYTEISVKSMNQFPAMLQLLISSGYAITGYEDNGNIDNSKILFLKSLTKDKISMNK